MTTGLGGAGELRSAEAMVEQHVEEAKTSLGWVTPASRLVVAPGTQLEPEVHWGA